MKDGSQRERRESLGRINESECLQKIEEWRDEGRSGGVEEWRCKLVEQVELQQLQYHQC